MKRVRQNARKRLVNQMRKSATKTLVGRAVTTAAGGDAEQTQSALVNAVSALDRAAKQGVLHPNAAARRKSRLMRKVNAAVGGALTAAAKPTRTTGKAQAAKAAKARVAAGKATKAKGEQTAAGKARAALTRTTRTAAAQPAVSPATTEEPATKSAATTGAKRTATPKATKTQQGTGKPAAKAKTAKS